MSTITWLTSAGVAAKLDISVHEVRRHSHDMTTRLPLPASGIPGYKLGRRWRYDEDEIDRFVKGVKPSGPRKITTRPSRAS